MKPRPSVALSSLLYPVMGQGATAPPTEFRIFAFGEFETLDGKSFLFDQESAKQVMEAARLKGQTQHSADYEHRSMFAAMTGTGEAPASAWYDLAVKPDGLWAVNVEWTDKAKEYLSTKQYRYWSPTFETEATSKGRPDRVKRLVNVALTNLPATRDMQPLAASEFATEEETKMKGLLALLGLSENATEAEAIAKYNAEKAAAEAAAASPLVQLSEATGKKTLSESLGTVLAWKKDAEEKVALSAEIEKHKAALAEASLKTTLDAYQKKGVVAPAERAQLEAMGRKDFAMLSEFLKVKSPVVRVEGAKPGDVPIPDADLNGVFVLDEAAEKIALSMGLNPEEVKKHAELRKQGGGEVRYRDLVRQPDEKQ